MSEVDTMIELAYLYGVHNKEIEEVEEFDDFTDKIKEHAANLPEWFERHDEVSPLEVLHNYFFEEVLGKSKQKR